jgi:DNA end-binding protein Ku
MSARPTWKGMLKISRVTIPIKVFPATESSDSLSFNQLHATCQTRISQRKWCVSCGREVTTAEIVKGFEFEKGKYVILLEDELDAVQPPSTKIIDLVQFADASELEPYSIDRSYYLAPDGPIAADAIAVLVIALRHHIGIGKLAIYGREYLVAVRPARVPAPATRQWVLMLHTLHHAAELRSADAIAELQGASRAPIDEVKMAQQVIAALVGPLDLGNFADQYRADTRRLIDAKIAGEEIVVPKLETPGEILNLKASLELSLAAVRATKKTPAKAKPVKRMRAS